MFIWEYGGYSPSVRFFQVKILIMNICHLLPSHSDNILRSLGKTPVQKVKSNYITWLLNVVEEGGLDIGHYRDLMSFFFFCFLFQQFGEYLYRHWHPMVDWYNLQLRRLPGTIVHSECRRPQFLPACVLCNISLLYCCSSTPSSDLGCRTRGAKAVVLDDICVLHVFVDCISRPLLT